MCKSFVKYDVFDKIQTFSAKNGPLLIKRSGPRSRNPDLVGYTGGYPVFNNLEPRKGKV